MNCPTCGGLVIHEPGYGPYEARDRCSLCGRDPNRVNKEIPMANNLDPEKEEEIKNFLITDSIRKIVEKTGVAKNTIARIRNKNFSEKQRAEMKKRANVKGRHGRELKKEGNKTMSEETTKMKDCHICGLEKPMTREFFSIHKVTRDGFDNRCKDCCSKAAKLRRLNLEKKDQQTRGQGSKKRDYKHEYKVREKRKVGEGPVPLDNGGLPKDSIILDAQLIKAIRRSVKIDFVRNELIPALEKMI